MPMTDELRICGARQQNVYGRCERPRGHGGPHITLGLEWGPPAPTHVYLFIIEDRHTDVEVHPYTKSTDALSAAQSYLLSVGHSGFGDDDCPDEWEFLATYSVEGDSVRIVKAELK